MNNSTILRLNSEQDIIEKNPSYQRKSEIWTLEKRQLLIDSILNNYDIPKLYFHVIQKKNKKSYAIIDGLQRLDTIWKFIDGDFPLANDFKYFQDSEVKAGGLIYSKLAEKYPILKIRFDSFVLPVICVETNDLDLIEDMFLRLNEAVPLNAAEKRNAIGGPMAKMIREVASHAFFKKNVKFSNKRYQHREVAARLLFLEYRLQQNNKIIDTKKSNLDAFVMKYKTKNLSIKAAAVADEVKLILDTMAEFFNENDSLLQSQSIITVYYLIFRERKAYHLTSLRFSRQDLLRFKKEVQNNRNFAAEDLSKANFDYLLYDKLSVQGTNDAINIRERYRILSEYLFGNSFSCI